MFSDTSQTSTTKVLTSATDISALINRIVLSNDTYNVEISKLTETNKKNLDFFNSNISPRNTLTETTLEKRLEEIKKEMDEIYKKDRNTKITAIILEKNYLSATINNLNLLSTEIYKRKGFFINMIELFTRLSEFTTSGKSDAEVKRFFYDDVLRYINQDYGYLNELVENTFLPKYLEFFIYTDETDLQNIEKKIGYGKVNGKWDFHFTDNSQITKNRLAKITATAFSLTSKREKSTVDNFFNNHNVVDICNFININEQIVRTNLLQLKELTAHLSFTINSNQEKLNKYSGEFKALMDFLANLIMSQYDSLLEIENALELHYMLVENVSNLYNDSTQYKHLSILNNLLVPVAIGTDIIVGDT